MLTRSINKQLFSIASVATVGVIGFNYFSTAGRISNDDGKTFTNRDEWVDLKLRSSVKSGTSAKHLIFELADPKDVSGLVDCSCVLTKYVTAKGNNVIRPYTPINDPDAEGILEFVIKKYDGGKMSSHIHDLKPNDKLSFRGPIVKWKWEPNQYKHVSLIAGGSGITPFYRLIHRITKNPDDKTKVDLFYGSITPDDILLKRELDELAEKHKDQLTITYFLDKPPTSWKGKTGYITKEFLKENLPPPSTQSKVFVCGPPGLYKAVCGTKTPKSEQGEITGYLAELGYTNEHVFKF